MSKVAILDCDFGHGEIESEILNHHGFSVVVGQASNEDESIDVGLDCVGLISQYAPVSARVADSLPNLKAVVRYGVGLDNVDVEGLRDRGIEVSGVPDYCTMEVADHCLALTLSLLRSIPQASELVQSGGWPTPHEIRNLQTLTGKTVGLVGFGRIAQEVAKRFQGFGCSLVGYDPYVSPEVFQTSGVTSVDLPTSLSADIVSLHLPLNTETRHLINARSVAEMRPGVFLINVSRGGLVDHEAIATALDSGHVAGFATDVIDPEGPGNPLALRADVIVTPHVAYFSPESLPRLRSRAAETMVELLTRQGPR